MDKDNGKECSIQLRHVPYDAAHMAHKTLFLIRHGESKWNAAQENTNIGAMLHFDHGLNMEGIEQAKKLNQLWKQARDKGDLSSPFVKSFLSDKAHVFASPFTRASETALIALQGHPAIQSQLRLLWTIRETKGLGGLDTVGKCVGDEIAARVSSELNEVIPNEAKEYIVPFEVGACVTAWWTPGEIKDTHKMLDERYHDLICTLTYSSFDTAILVGHSLFFRNFCQRYVGETLKLKDRKFAKSLTSEKIENAACLALGFDCDTRQIVAAEFMFGTSFHVANKKHKK